jgi:hypothetical protein
MTCCLLRPLAQNARLRRVQVESRFHSTRGARGRNRDDLVGGGPVDQETGARTAGPRSRFATRRVPRPFVSLPDQQRDGKRSASFHRLSHLLAGTTTGAGPPTCPKRASVLCSREGDDAVTVGRRDVDVLAVRAPDRQVVPSATV